MTIRDEILNLPKEEIEKMNLLSQLERDITKTKQESKSHDELIRHNAIMEQHINLQKFIWVGTVVLLALGIIFK